MWIRTQQAPASSTFVDSPARPSTRGRRTASHGRPRLFDLWPSEQRVCASSAGMASRLTAWRTDIVSRNIPPVANMHCNCHGAATRRGTSGIFCPSLCAQGPSMAPPHPVPLCPWLPERKGITARMERQLFMHLNMRMHAPRVRGCSSSAVNFLAYGVHTGP